MATDIETLAKNFTEKNYEVYFNGKAEDLQKLFDKDAPLNTLLTMVSERIKNLEKLENLGLKEYENITIRDEKKKLENIKINFETLRDDLKNEDPREAIKEFVGREDKDITFGQSFSELIHKLIYKIFPSIYNKDKGAVEEGIREDLKGLEGAQQNLGAKVKELEKQEAFKDQSIQKVFDMVSERIDALSDIKDNLIKVCAIRPQAEIMQDRKSFVPDSLEPDYKTTRGGNILIALEIMKISLEIKELQAQNYQLVKFQDKLANAEKSRPELFNEFKNKLQNSKMENSFSKEFQNAVINISEGKDVGVLDSIGRLRGFKEELNEKSKGLKESSISLKYEMERTAREQNVSKRARGGDDEAWKKLKDRLQIHTSDKTPTSSPVQPTANTSKGRG